MLVCPERGEERFPSVPWSTTRSPVWSETRSRRFGFQFRGHIHRRLPFGVFADRTPRPTRPARMADFRKATRRNHRGSESDSVQVSLSTDIVVCPPKRMTRPRRVSSAFGHARPGDWCRSLGEQLCPNVGPDQRERPEYQNGRSYRCRSSQACGLDHGRKSHRPPCVRRGWGHPEREDSMPEHLLESVPRNPRSPHSFPTRRKEQCVVASRHRSPTGHAGPAVGCRLARAVSSADCLRTAGSRRPRRYLS